MGFPLPLIATPPNLSPPPSGSPEIWTHFPFFLVIAFGIVRFQLICIGGSFNAATTQTAMIDGPRYTSTVDAEPRRGGRRQVFELSQPMTSRKLNQS